MECNLSRNRPNPIKRANASLAYKRAPIATLVHAMKSCVCVIIISMVVPGVGAQG